MDAVGGMVVVTRDAEIHLVGDGIRITKAALNAIRPIGGGNRAETAFPMPPPVALEVIAERCGAKPGDHGPTIWD